MPKRRSPQDEAPSSSQNVTISISAYVELVHESVESPSSRKRVQAVQPTAVCDLSVDVYVPSLVNELGASTLNQFVKTSGVQPAALPYTHHSFPLTLDSPASVFNLPHIAVAQSLAALSVPSAEALVNTPVILALYTTSREQPPIFSSPAAATAAAAAAAAALVANGGAGPPGRTLLGTMILPLSSLVDRAGTVAAVAGTPGPNALRNAARTSPPLAAAAAQLGQRVPTARRQSDSMPPGAPELDGTVSAPPATPRDGPPSRGGTAARHIGCEMTLWPNVPQTIAVVVAARASRPVLPHGYVPVYTRVDALSDPPPLAAPPCAVVRFPGARPVVILPFPRPPTPPQARGAHAAPTPSSVVQLPPATTRRALPLQANALPTGTHGGAAAAHSAASAHGPPTPRAAHGADSSPAVTWPGGAPRAPAAPAGDARDIRFVGAAVAFVPDPEVRPAEYLAWLQSVASGAGPIASGSAAMLSAPSNDIWITFQPSRILPLAPTAVAAAAAAAATATTAANASTGGGGPGQPTSNAAPAAPSTAAAAAAAAATAAAKRRALQHNKAVPDAAPAVLLHGPVYHPLQADAVAKLSLRSIALEGATVARDLVPITTSRAAADRGWCVRRMSSARASVSTAHPLPLVTFAAPLTAPPTLSPPPSATAPAATPPPPDTRRTALPTIGPGPTAAVRPSTPPASPIVESPSYTLSRSVIVMRANVNASVLQALLAAICARPPPPLWAPIVPARPAAASQGDTRGTDANGDGDDNETPPPTPTVRHETFPVAAADCVSGFEVIDPNLRVFVVEGVLGTALRAVDAFVRANARSVLHYLPGCATAPVLRREYDLVDAIRVAAPPAALPAGTDAADAPAVPSSVATAAAGRRGVAGPPPAAHAASSGNAGGAVVGATPSTAAGASGAVPPPPVTRSTIHTRAVEDAHARYEAAARRVTAVESRPTGSKRRKREIAAAKAALATEAAALAAATRGAAEAEAEAGRRDALIADVGGCGSRLVRLRLSASLEALLAGGSTQAASAADAVLASHVGLLAPAIAAGPSADGAGAAGGGGTMLDPQPAASTGLISRGASGGGGGAAHGDGTAAPGGALASAHAGVALDKLVRILRADSVDVLVASGAFPTAAELLSLGSVYGAPMRPTDVSGTATSLLIDGRAVQLADVPVTVVSPAVDGHDGRPPRDELTVPRIRTLTELLPRSQFAPHTARVPRDGAAVRPQSSPSALPAAGGRGDDAPTSPAADSSPTRAKGGDPQANPQSSAELRSLGGRFVLLRGYFPDQARRRAFNAWRTKYSVGLPQQLAGAGVSEALVYLPPPVDEMVVVISRTHVPTDPNDTVLEVRVSGLVVVSDAVFMLASQITHGPSARDASVYHNTEWVATARTRALQRTIAAERARASHRSARPLDRRAAQTTRPQGDNGVQRLHNSDSDVSNSEVDAPPLCDGANHPPALLTYETAHERNMRDLGNLALTTPRAPRTTISSPSSVQMRAVAAKAGTLEGAFYAVPWVVGRSATASEDRVRL